MYTYTDHILTYWEMNVDSALIVQIGYQSNNVAEDAVNPRIIVTFMKITPDK